MSRPRYGNVSPHCQYGWSRGTTREGSQGKGWPSADAVSRGGADVTDSRWTIVNFINPVTGVNATGCKRLVEYQFAGDSEGHAIPRR